MKGSLLKRNMKRVKKDKFRRELYRGKLGIETPGLRRPKLVSGQESLMDAYAKRDRGGDRRAVNMQLHAALNGDVEIDVTGKGILPQHRAFFNKIFVEAT